MSRPPRELSSAVDALASVAMAAWASLANEVGQHAAGRAIAYADRLLCCANCLSSLVSELMEDMEPALFEEKTALPGRASPVGLVDWDRFISDNYPAEEQDEMRRAFDDLWEVLEQLACRLLPALSENVASGRPLDPRVVGETSRELEHLKYHLETDLIGRATVSMSWSENEENGGPIS